MSGSDEDFMQRSFGLDSDEEETGNDLRPNIERLTVEGKSYIHTCLDGREIKIADQPEKVKSHHHLFSFFMLLLESRAVVFITCCYKNMETGLAVEE